MSAPRLLAHCAAMFLVPALLFVAPVASAGPAVAADPLDTPAGAIPIDPPQRPRPGIDSDQRPQKVGDKILYINFDGGQMNACNNDSPQQDCSTIFGGTVLPFTGDVERQATIIQIIRRRVEDFGITVTDERPQSGDYDMEMVGDWQGASPDFAGIAPSIDCFDNSGGETSFTLEASTGTTDGIAEIVLQEVAHTWGLEHVDEQSDLLYPTTEGQNKVFQDTCHKIVADTDLSPSNGFCNNVHSNACQSGFQNSHADLLLVFGPSIPDTIAPTIEILSPDDGETLETGDVDLLVDFTDDQRPAVISATVVLESDALPAPVELQGAYASPGETVFPITGLPSGTYRVRVDIEDESANPASAQVQFTVLGDPIEGEDTGGDPDDAGSSESGDADETGGDDAGGEDTTGTGGGVPMADNRGGDEGCGCHTSQPRSGLAGWLLLGLGFIPRRRSLR